MNNFGLQNLLHRTVWVVVISVHKENAALYFTMKMVSEYSFETSARPTLEKPWQHPKQDKNNAAKNTQVQFRFYLSISIIIIIIIIIVIYSCYPFRGHRASTKHSHLVLFPAILITSLYLFPFSNSSFWTVLPYVCLCLPLLIFSCGFHSKASLSMAS